MTSFGQLTRLADEAFSDAAALARRTPESVAATDVSAAIAKASAILARCTDQVAAGFGLRTNAWSHTATDAALSLHRAAAITRSEQGPEPYSLLACRLRTAAETFGCALDVLSSHTTTNFGTTGVVVTTDDAAHHLLTLVSGHARTLSAIADHAPPDSAVNQALPLLRQAAAATRPGPT
jgi:hypothetical protein